MSGQEQQVKRQKPDCGALLLAYCPPFIAFGCLAIIPQERVAAEFVLQALAQELASHGYVVAVISHAYSGWDVFARDGFVMSSNHWWGSEAMSDVDQQKMVETLNDALAGDARFVLDRLVDMNDEEAGTFTGAFDLDRVAIAGHSRGGKTVSRACSMDPRFKAAIIYDNVGPLRESASGLTQPLLNMRTASDRWSDERVQQLHDYLARTGERCVRNSHRRCEPQLVQ